MLGGTASGGYSFAVGIGATASGLYSVAMGRDAAATGSYSLAIWSSIQLPLACFHWHLENIQLPLETFL